MCVCVCVRVYIYIYIYIYIYTYTILPKFIHQWHMCTYGYSHFIQLKTVSKEVKIILSVGQSHWGPEEAVLPSPAEEVQPATGAAVTVVLCHYWICPLHVNNCLVQLGYQMWPQKTTESSLDCWANHWYKPPHSPRNVLIQSEQKGW